jgi:N-acetylglucosaminyl-diphospho-decaprenol L-rhamnosyltransferase
LEGLLLAAAAVIVTFNSEEVVDGCLKALAEMHVTPIVVDNASIDRTVERAQAHPGVCVIANRENRGFAAAANQGVRATESEFILLLNPDAQLLTSVDALVDASRQYGLAAGKLVDADGRPQTGFTLRRFPTPAAMIFELFGINRVWPSNPVNRRYRYLDRDLEQPGSVEQPAGALLMTRRDVWERLGGLDEGFHPIWFEDVDYCRRAVDAGYRIEYVPAVTARHLGAHSIARIPPGCRAVYWCVSLLRYAAKHFQTWGFEGVCAAMALSSVPRMLAAMVHERSLEPITVYCKIVRIAGRALSFPGRRGVVKITNS